MSKEIAGSLRHSSSRSRTILRAWKRSNIRPSEWSLCRRSSGRDRLAEVEAVHQEIRLSRRGRALDGESREVAIVLQNAGIEAEAEEQRAIARVGAQSKSGIGYGS